MELFVLGAGFSRSFVDSAPLLNRFLAGRENLLERDGFLDAKRFIDQCRFDASTANVETVMTLAHQHDRNAAEQLKKLLVEVLDESFPTEEWNQGTMYRFRVNHADILRAFAHHLLERSPRMHNLRDPIR